MQSLRGLFYFPYTSQDYIVLLLAFLGTAYRIYIMYHSQEKAVEIKEIISVVIISGILTIGLYEIAIDRAWRMTEFYLPFAACIILAKDITDWLFQSKEGRRFAINTFKTMVESLLGSFGYKKRDNEN